MDEPEALPVLVFEGDGAVAEVLKSFFVRPEDGHDRLWRASSG